MYIEIVIDHWNHSFNTFYKIQYYRYSWDIQYVCMYRDILCIYNSEGYIWIHKRTLTYIQCEWVKWIRYIKSMCISYLYADMYSNDSSINLNTFYFSAVGQPIIPNVIMAWDPNACRDHVSTTKSTHEGSMCTDYMTNWTVWLGWWIQDVFIIPLKAEHQLPRHFLFSPWGYTCSHT